MTYLMRVLKELYGGNVKEQQLYEYSSMQMLSIYSPKVSRLVPTSANFNYPGPLSESKRK